MKTVKYYYVTIETGGTATRFGSRVPVLAGLDGKAVLAAAKEFAETVELPPFRGQGYLTFHTIGVAGSGKHMLPSLHAHFTERCSFVGDPEDCSAIDDSEDAGRTKILDGVINRRLKRKGTT
jgi:hypothetical protein